MKIRSHLPYIGVLVDPKWYAECTMNHDRSARARGFCYHHSYKYVILHAEKREDGNLSRRQTVGVYCIQSEYVVVDSCGR